MLFSTTYNQITNNSKGIYKAKGSKFIAYAIIVKSEEQVLDEINKIKKLDKNANHYCFAYIIKPDKSIEKVNDDGEPKNSAGKPILGQIKSKDLTNCLIVVVRYFGGTKLGIPGLIKAYKYAALEAIQNNKIECIDITEMYSLKFSYEELNLVMNILKNYNANIINHKNDMISEIECSITLKNSKNFYDKISKNHKIDIKYLKTK
ncbi:MAG: IMPACT family protein [Flavobacteriales bacterium]|tara:strand:+ start:529 stop:1143 length:615 start_codon:yes stop_codon:yes gene_type:complete